MSEFIEKEQNEFSDGVNWVDDPIKLGPKELADARNIRLVTNRKIRQRDGYTQYNSSAIGASTVIRSIFQFEGYDGTYLPLCQADDDKIYKGSAAFAGTGSWSSILTQTSGSIPASFDAMWGKMVMTNNVDIPQVWEGNYGKCAGFKKTTDNASTYLDYSSEVSDADTTTVAKIGGLDTAANGDWFLVGSWVPKLTGIRFEMDGTNVNAITATIAIHRWDGSAWQAVTVTDGTAASGKTFAQTGDATFTEATTTLQDIDRRAIFWWRVSVSAAISATVNFRAVKLIYNIQDLKNVWSGKFFRPLGFKTSSDTSVTFKDYTKEVIDDSTSTFAELGALTVTTGVAYIQSTRKFIGAKITMSTTNVNTNAVTMTAKYWNNAWSSLTITDGSSANSKTLAQGGMITWAWQSDFEKRRLTSDEVLPTYQIQLLFSAALSANVQILEIELIEYMEPLRPHKFCLFHKNRLFLANRADHPNYVFYSAAFAPEIHTGTDAGLVGLPSGKEITAFEKFYNDLFIATADEIYLLEGYTPDTFGLLKINTGGVGVVASKSVVAVGKYIYFMHSTGFYRFDGIGVQLISAKVNWLFDETKTSYVIPNARYSQIQGRFNRVFNTIEWTIPSGSSQANNNLIPIFDVANESWLFDNYVAASMLKTTGSAYQDLLYHGDYVGKVHRDANGTTDNGTAITSTLTTKGFQLDEDPGTEIVFRGVKALFDTQSSGTATIAYAMSGSTTFTDISTMSFVLSGYGSVWRELFSYGLGTSVQLKLTQSGSGVTFGLHSIRVLLSRVRSRYMNE